MLATLSVNLSFATFDLLQDCEFITKGHIPGAHFDESSFFHLDLFSVGVNLSIAMVGCSGGYIGVGVCGVVGVVLVILMWGCVG